MNEYEVLLESVSRLANELQDLNKEAVREYGPEVDAILLSGNRDARHIEHTLDGLLDFCGYEPALMLYKNLCRYYFDIDPTATVSYINAYCEMWDSEPEGERGDQ
jgi:hypothetical protein